MTTLDRYIARQFLLNVALLLVLLASFVVMVDVSLNLGRFVGAAERLLAAPGEADGLDPARGEGISPLRRAALTVLLVFNLWWPRLLQLFNFVLPLVMVGAMGFTFTQLVRQREVVAMLAGGVSLYRVARPVLLCAAALSLVQVLNQELVIPRIAPLLTRDPGSAAGRGVESFAVPVTPDGQGRLISAARFEHASGTLHGVNVWERDASGRAVRRISAERATFDGQAWTLERPTVIALSMRPGLAPGASPSLPPPPAAANPAPTAAPAAAAPDRLVTDLDPPTILANQFSAFSQTLSWVQIRDALATPGLKPRVRDRLERVGWGRLSALLCGLLSLVIALPFFLTREPRNMILQSLKAAPVAIVTLLGGVLGTAAPVPGLPPAFAVFLPVLVLAPLAVEAATRIRT